MMGHTISKLARLFHLARSTLLYYHRVGLLVPSGRTAAGYRVYSEGDRERLARICAFRQAGLALEDIRTMLETGERPSAAILEQRFHQIGQQILELRNQQRVIGQMLRQMAANRDQPVVDKALWVSMLRAAGLDEAAMGRWHAEFEARAPAGHQEFLVSLGLPEDEVRLIRQRSAGPESKPAGSRKHATEARGSGTATKINRPTGLL